ncbi:uncharacterized protein LOC130898022 isoform X1 [Diorhabda carinulata]|uniref:uncharacterized protein LOC130898022 isoform X1 n=2 Tax=Diorhabda carinulata TaxID=1163345 RepID=UPI0025A114AD|nr:uncharacterized protein LOC130898022 isoform X1 [Diorhabda carinulata]
MAVPYVLQIQEDVKNVHITTLNDRLEDETTQITYLPQIKEELHNMHLTDKTTRITYLPNVSTDLQIPMPLLTPLKVNGQNIVKFQIQNSAESHRNYVYQVVNPKQLNPQPIEKLKKGRKKKKIEEPQEQKKEPAKVLKPATRTRSGRVVRFPKHIEKDFKKVEIKESKKSNLEGDVEIETSDFTQFKEEPVTKCTNMQQLDVHQRPRRIAAQYRCPKCLKAYMGKTKMIQHIKKYPDHGPLPQKENSSVNFEVWNYLVDITQKCSTAQRGIKFCEELTNLLHNVLLLTSALFKKVEENKNFVEVDKVLGNAIGLTPGFYTFNDSELYKDVTVLKLITTTDFFKPVHLSNTGKDKIESSVVETQTSAVKKEINIHSETKNNVYFNSQEDLRKSPAPRIHLDLEDMKEKIIPMESDPAPTRDKSTKDGVDNISKSLEDVYFTAEDDLRKPQTFCIPEMEHKINTNLEDKDEITQIDSELLSDHSLLHLSNIRSTVDDLMLTTVDPGGTLLDNLTNSDEVMNVDQFVNERFKKITEPDMELTTPSLNLELPGLDLFQFHTT